MGRRSTAILSGVGGRQAACGIRENYDPSVSQSVLPTGFVKKNARAKSKKKERLLLLRPYVQGELDRERCNYKQVFCNKASSQYSKSKGFSVRLILQLYVFFKIKLLLFRIAKYPCSPD